MSDFQIEASGVHAMADQDVCVAVGEDLSQHYPGHPWCVGCNHDAGTVVIRLAYDPPSENPRLAEMGYLLHLTTVLGAGGQKRVMQAGGEMLERWGLSRNGATIESRVIAATNGLDTDAASLKSKH